MEVVTLVVSILAISVSVVSIILSILFSGKASTALSAIKDQAESIEKDIRNRLDDLVRRAAPTEQERAMSAVLPELLKGVLSEPETVKLLIKEGLKQRKDAPG